MDERIKNFLEESSPYDIEDVIDYMALYGYKLVDDFDVRLVKKRTNYALLKGRDCEIEIEYVPKLWSWKIKDLKMDETETRERHPFEAMVMMLRSAAKRGVMLTAEGLQRVLRREAPGKFEYELLGARDKSNGVVVTSTTKRREKIAWASITVCPSRGKITLVPTTFCRERFPRMRAEMLGASLKEVIAALKKLQSEHKRLVD